MSPASRSLFLFGAKHLYIHIYAVLRGDWVEAIKSPSHFVMRAVVIGYDSYPEVFGDIAILKRFKHEGSSGRRALQHRAQNIAEFWQAIHQPSPHSDNAVWVV